MTNTVESNRLPKQHSVREWLNREARRTVGRLPVYTKKGQIDRTPYQKLRLLNGDEVITVLENLSPGKTPPLVVRIIEGNNTVANTITLRVGVEGKEKTTIRRGTTYRLESKNGLIT